MKLLILLIFSLDLYASNIQSYELGLGQFYELPYQTEKSESEIFQLSPTIKAKLNYRLSDNYIFIPSFNWVIYKTHENDSSNQNIFISQFDIKRRINDHFSISLGTSIITYSTSGDGSENNLPNGTGETTYFAPNERKNSWQQNLSFGGFYTNDEVNYGLEFFSFKILNEELRETSLMFSIAKIFDWEGK